MRTGFKDKSASLCRAIRFQLELRAALSGPVFELSALFSQHPTRSNSGTTLKKLSAVRRNVRLPVKPRPGNSTLLPFLLPWAMLREPAPLEGANGSLGLRDPPMPDAMLGLDAASQPMPCAQLKTPQQSACVRALEAGTDISGDRHFTVTSWNEFCFQKTAYVTCPVMWLTLPATNRAGTGDDSGQDSGTALAKRLAHRYRGRGIKCRTPSQTYRTCSAHANRAADSGGEEGTRRGFTDEVTADWGVGGHGQGSTPRRGRRLSRG